MFGVITKMIPLHSINYIVLEMSGFSPRGSVRLRPGRPLHQDPPQRSDNANTYSEAFRQIKNDRPANILRFVIIISENYFPNRIMNNVFDVFVNVILIINKESKYF